MGKDPDSTAPGVHGVVVVVGEGPEYGRVKRKLCITPTQAAWKL